MSHWNDPPPGVTPHCPLCDTPRSWDAPIYCDRCVGDYLDAYEPIIEDTSERMYR